MKAQKALERLRSTVREVSPQEARAAQARGAVIIDVREPDEISQGSPAGAERIVRGFLELSIEEVAPGTHTPLLTICAGGARSLFAADDLLRLGYTDVSSIAGGFQAWKEAGLPIETPRVLTDAERERYGRHLLIPEVGEAGQARLLDAKVLLVGAGGLGSPAAYYLAAAGVGTLGIVDDDRVERSNLQRQILHSDDRVGSLKVDSARRTLTALNPAIRVEGHPVRLNAANVEELLAGYDVIVDGTDNFPTRYLVNDASVRLGKPNVHAAVFRFEGQASVFWPARPERPGPCYRCLYAEPPPPELAPSCAEAGVLGVLPGVMGLIQAVETVKLLLGIGEPLVGRLLQYDALAQRFSELRLERDLDCRWCSDPRSFPGYEELAHACGTAPRGAAE